MTTGVACPPVILQFFDNRGNPLVGGSILTQVGGVNAPTYSDSGLTAPLPNPIVLNSRGEVSTSSGTSAQLFLTPNTVYTFTASDAGGNQIWVATYVNGAQMSQALIGEILWPQTSAEATADITPQYYYYMEGDIRRYGALTTADDNSGAINDALTVSTNGGRPAYVPGGTWKITAAIAPGAQSCLYGDGMVSIISAQGCNGLNFQPGAGYGTATGVNRFFRDFQLLGSNSVNSTYVGININFTAASGNEVVDTRFQNIFITNFGTAAYLRGLWDSSFEGCMTYNCYYGLYFIGQNVRNAVVNSNFVRGTITGAGGAWGISFQTTAGESTQSTQIIGSGVYGYDINIECALAFETQIEACDLSNCQGTCVDVVSTLGGFWLRDSWVEMNNASAVTAINIANLGTPVNFDVHIVGNHIHNDQPHAGSTAVYVGNGQNGVSILDNYVDGFDQGVNLGANSNLVCKFNRIDINSSVYSAASYAVQVNTFALAPEIGPNAVLSSAKQAATMVNASANIGVTSSGAFPAGTRVQFDATANGFTVGVSYMVLSSAANVITVGSRAGATAIAATGAAAVNVMSSPVPLVTNAGTPPGLRLYASGAFIGELSGFATDPTGILDYEAEGGSVALNVRWTDTLTGTSNATTMTLLGLPAFLAPINTQQTLAAVCDEGTFQYGSVTVKSDQTVTFHKDANSGGFTASGTKGLNTQPMIWLLR